MSITDQAPYPIPYTLCPMPYALIPITYAPNSKPVLLKLSNLSSVGGRADVALCDGSV